MPIPRISYFAKWQETTLFTDVYLNTKKNKTAVKSLFTAVSPIFYF